MQNCRANSDHQIRQCQTEAEKRDRTVADGSQARAVQLTRKAKKNSEGESDLIRQANVGPTRWSDDKMDDP